DSNQRFMGGYALMDVLLDATPFSGHTTTCEALWMGVPVLTLYGDRRAGRMSASVLKQVGMADWIAKTPEEYVRKAAALAKNTKHIADVRRGLRRRMLASALCDC